MCIELKILYANIQLRLSTEYMINLYSTEYLGNLENIYSNN